MKLLFKQRFFSWFDSYDIYDETGATLFTVEGQLAWGHTLHINDAEGRHIATVKQQVLTFLPRFDLYLEEDLVGTITKAFTFFRPAFEVDCNGWQVASVSKELWNWTDTYTIDVVNDRDALCALMVVLAIDAEKCSRD